MVDLLGELMVAPLARAAERYLGVFKPQGLANTSWAFAMAGLLDELRLAALAKAAERGLGEFEAQNLANTAWAFAKADRWMCYCLRH